MAAQSAQGKDSTFDYPKLRKVIKTDADNADSEHNVFWDVKFYPYGTDPNSRPVFALANRTSLLVYRIDQDRHREQDIKLLQALAVSSGETFDEDFVSLSWAHLDQAEPLLIGGGDSGLLRVFDVRKGDLKATLIGHGRGTINDLATHPIYPWIVASASQDTSIRIWDLRRWNSKHEPQCVVICGHGHGHSESVLSVSWHDNGRYLITGAHDHRICVWTVPDLSPGSAFWKEISPAERKRSSEEIRIIYYPHFTTSAVHMNVVDCVRFYGDTIFSKAAEEHKIVWWSITGFNSDTPPPDAVLAPKMEEHLDTRNGFTRTYTTSSDGVQSLQTREVYENMLPYTRLLEFQADDCEPFFIRFGLLKPSSQYPDLHPMLAIGNTKSQVFFWNLRALEIGDDKHPPKPKQIRRRKGMPQRVDHLAESSSVSMNSFASPSRSSSLAYDNSTDASTPFSEPAFSNTLENNIPSIAPSNTQTPDRVRFALHRPSSPLTQAHYRRDIPDFKEDTVTARSVAWSNDGRWCVVAAESQAAHPKSKKVMQIGAAAVFGRWLPQDSKDAR